MTRLVRLVWVQLIGLPLLASLAIAQGSAIYTPAEEAKKLVIRLDGAGVDGAGIVVGYDQEKVYGVTAKHVIQGRRGVAKGLTARLRSWSKPLPATVIRGHALKDIAVFEVAYGGLGLKPSDIANAVPFASLGSTGKLNGESGIFTIGHGAGGGWIDAREPIRLASFDVSGGRGPDVLRLQHFCPGGHSGGAVFDQQWRLVGMITDNHEPFCHALSIETVLAVLADWQLEYRLAPAVVEGEEPPPDAGDTIVAVTGFDNRSGVKMPHIGPAGRDIITSALFNLPGIRLVTRDRLESVLAELNLRPTVGSTQGVSRLGKLLDVDALISGSVNRYDVERREFNGYRANSKKDSYHMSVTLQIIDVDTALVRFSKTYDIETQKVYQQGSSAPREPLQLESELLKQVLEEQAQGDIQLALRQVSSGTTTPIAVTITSHPAGAEVVVGDVYEGSTPVTLHLSIGLHEIELRKAGYRLWQRSVRVDHDMKPLEVHLAR